MEPKDETVTITAKKFKRLMLAYMELQALNAAGVDNWDGSYYAYKDYCKTVKAQYPEWASSVCGDDDEEGDDDD